MVTLNSILFEREKMTIPQRKRVVSHTCIINIFKFNLFLSTTNTQWQRNSYTFAQSIARIRHSSHANSIHVFRLSIWYFCHHSDRLCVHTLQLCAGQMRSYTVQTDAKNCHEFRRRCWGGFRKRSKVGPKIRTHSTTNNIARTVLDVFRYLFRVHGNCGEELPTSGRTLCRLRNQFTALHIGPVDPVNSVGLDTKLKIFSARVDDSQCIYGRWPRNYVLLFGHWFAASYVAAGHWIDMDNAAILFDNNIRNGSHWRCDAARKSNEDTAKLDRHMWCTKQRHVGCYIGLYFAGILGLPTIRYRHSGQYYIKFADWRNVSLIYMNYMWNC